MIINVEVHIPIWIEVNEEEYKKNLESFEYLDNFEDYVYSKYLEQVLTVKPEIRSCYLENDNNWGEHHEDIEACVIAMETKLKENEITS